MTGRKRVGILISGRGSNMEALIRAARASDYPAEISVVISNRRDADGLAKAAAAGVPTAVVEGLNDRAALEAAINARLDEAKVEIVCLAGFMRLLTEAFVARWHDRLLNIHPSLLPAFPGLDTHARVLAAGHQRHGCTVHFVRAAVDSGPIVAQAEVPVMPGDTESALAGRVLAEEHRLYPYALALVAAGRAVVAGDRVLIDGTPGPAQLGLATEAAR
jgi:formyltetrahydrofolate-dependent phosphoribosylglycinamide formyltransferase